MEINREGEAYRAACEAWWVINVLPKIQGWGTVKYLNAVEKHRGKKGRDELWKKVTCLMECR